MSRIGSAREQGVFMNISITDYISAHFHYFRDLIILVRKFMLVYRNAPSVLLNITKRKYPFEALTAHGELEVISSYREALYNVLISRTPAASDYHIDLDFTNGVATVGPKLCLQHVSSNLKLYDSINNGDIFGIFMDGEYDRLDVAGKTVIDVGANIGDSAIYFICRGASRVIAIEPFPRNYETAMKNILANNLRDKITLLLAGCAGVSANIMVDANNRSPTNQLTEVKHGIKVQLRTLQEIMDENNVREKAILKMDCEGYEYDIILSATKETLQKFQQIQIEYHYGYKNLKKKLDECGFKVEVTRPEIPSLLLRYFRGLSRLTGRQESQKGIDDTTQSKYASKQKSIYESGYLGYLFATNASPRASDISR